MLAWEDADTDEPGDQNAVAAYTPPDCTVAFYGVGPGRPGEWTLSLTGLAGGDEVFHSIIGRFGSPDAAKQAAQRLNDGEDPNAVLDTGNHAAASEAETPISDGLVI